MEPEIPASAPILNVGKRTCALYPRSWTDAKGTVRTTITLAEVVPAQTRKNEAGELVVVSWKRMYKGLNFGLETREEWVSFAEDLNGAFARGVQQSLASNGVQAKVTAKR